jgi:hypothetical protein
MNRREFVLAAAAAPFALRLPRPLAYVTADLQSHVAVVDLERGTVVRRIPTQAGPRSVERVGDSALVAHTVGGQLSILHGTDVRHVVEGMVEPRYTAAAADGRHAFVSDSGEPQVVAVDVQSGAIVGRLKLKLWPRHVARDGDTLLVALGTASPELAVVDVSDPRRPRLIRYRQAPFAVHDVGLSPDGRLWLTSGDAKTIWAGRTLAAGSPPQHLTFLGGRAYVTSGDDGTLRIHRLDGSLVRESRIAAGSYNVQFGAGRVFTPSLASGWLTVLGGPIALVARSSHDACLAPP